MGPIPRVVVAGVPMRMPEAMFGGFASNGIAFLLTVIPTSSSSVSASRPVTPRGVTSTRARWLSVPPETSRAPASRIVSARTEAFSMVRAWSRRKPSVWARCRATALAAITCIRGPPWTPGKTDLSIAWASVLFPSAGKSARSMPGGRSARANTRPPRGPRSVLWVVVVMMSAWGNGLGCRPAATRPATCAMSTNSSAPTPCAIAASRSKSQVRG